MLVWWLKDYDVIGEEDYDFVEALELFEYNPKELTVKHLKVLRERLTGMDFDEIKCQLRKIIEGGDF